MYYVALTHVITYFAVCIFVSAWQLPTKAFISRKTHIVSMQDYPKPSNIDKTQNYKEAERLSSMFQNLKSQSKNVAIIGLYL